MHISSYNRMKYLVEWYKPYIKREGAIKVLDIGSCAYGIDGTYKEFLSDSAFQYHGLDMVPGPNVDIVPKDVYSWDEIANDTYDLVISGQCFEHIEFPWLTIKEIARVLKPSGFCIITAPNAGMEHKAPMDCYRYFADGMSALAKWAGLHIHHTSVAGVSSIHISQEWINQWNDCFLVAQKNPIVPAIIEDPFPYEVRWLQDGTKNITYKTFKIATKEIRKRNQDNRKYILYGAGDFGSKFLAEMPKEDVAFFCDGNEQRAGTVFCGKKVISFDELKKLHSEYHVVITVSFPASQKIAQMLTDNGISYEQLYWDTEK